MQFSKLFSAQVVGLVAHIIDVEVDLSKGLNAFAVVGLPSTSVDESRDRVSAAIKNSGFDSPKQKNQKVVISLAPAELKKEGAHYDLPIALAYLIAAGETRFDPAGKLFLGELSLDGVLRPVRGTLLLASAAKKAGFTEIFLPIENAEEAALVEGIMVYGVRNLREALDHLDKNNKFLLTPCPRAEVCDVGAVSRQNIVDLSHIKGQEFAKRALEIAAAGNHNLAMWGPPGTGKTMLAQAFPHLLPDLQNDHALEVTGIHSVAGTLRENIMTRPPLRAPHHTASYPAVIGGGSTPKPGEITLAHRGVLFLDEFPEFDRRVIESLREPLEEGHIRITRSKGHDTFPARFILLAAMNPCPCGKYGSEERCTCMPGTLASYTRKLSGPIVDRIELWVKVSHMSHDKLAEKSVSESTEEVRSRIANARAIQQARFANHARKITTNSEMRADDIEAFIELTPKLRTLFNAAAERLKLSPRAHHKTIKVARTIADLDASDEIEEKHLLEALAYRPTELK
ncbi:MAG: YifB family Mg chelatase-like AAA ATPase [Candidatus Pacebacteria bacterium]|jgi:magnesium chelatase family protein|nr:YifB family Mg chelatase-like AAA ATPase [Candidatus Paceibacterota bacterium]